ncbi:hypothetical protein MTO96_048762 [Rhipicephalus appendiculatus]
MAPQARTILFQFYAGVGTLNQPDYGEANWQRQLSRGTDAVTGFAEPKSVALTAVFTTSTVRVRSPA